MVFYKISTWENFYSSCSPSLFAGAYFIQHGAQRFYELQQMENYGDGHSIDNVLLLLCYLYNFKVSDTEFSIFTNCENLKYRSLVKNRSCFWCVISFGLHWPFLLACLLVPYNTGLKMALQVADIHVWKKIPEVTGNKKLFFAAVRKVYWTKHKILFTIMLLFIQVAHHVLIFDLMSELVNAFGEKDVELLLLILKCKYAFFIYFF